MTTEVPSLLHGSRGRATEELTLCWCGGQRGFMERDVKGATTCVSSVSYSGGRQGAVYMEMR